MWEQEFKAPESKATEPDRGTEPNPYPIQIACGKDGLIVLLSDGVLLEEKWLVKDDGTGRHRQFVEVPGPWGRL